MAESVEQLDPTESLTVDNIKKKVVSGAFVLTFRTILLQGVSFVAVALLTIFLEPAQFGVFFIVSSVINFLAYFSDIGFAAALIQKKDKPEEVELKTIFTIQLVLVLSLVFCILLATPLIQSTYKFSSESIFLLWALSLSLLFSSLKTIPSVLLERRLDFGKLIIPQIAETLIFNISAVYFASEGFGVTSFTIAVLIRGILGLVLMYIIQPWLPGFAFSKDSLKSLLKFGIPYQGNTILAMIKDDGMTLVLGSILGSSGIGLLAWAQKWAFSPLRFFMDQVIKVTFPAFSRIQDNKKELSDAVSKSIFFICIFVFPSIVLLNLIASPLTEIIPKYEKWQGALLALSLLSITSAFAAISTPLTNLFNAIGKISITFKLMIMWTTFTWLSVPALSLFYGVSGAALGFMVVGLTSIIPLVIAKKYVDINYFQIVVKPVTATIIMGFIVYAVSKLLPISFIQIILMVSSGLSVYIISLLILEPNLKGVIKTIVKRLIKK